MKQITSLQNDLIKNIIKLGKAGERSKQRLIIIEGLREIKLAVQAGFKIDTILYCNNIVKIENTESGQIDLTGFKSLLGLETGNFDLIEVSENVYSKIAYRDSFDGLMAIAERKTLSLADINLSETPLLIVLETVEKPGNLGAILRTADAAKVDAIIICDNQTDIYNPNVIRSSLGSVFTNKIICCTGSEALTYLRNQNIMIFAASVQADNPYFNTNFKQPSAILLGSEAFGLSDFWNKNADVLIKIPMFGRIDSLNVSVSAAVVIYEAVRQRAILK